jgi:flavin reductase (DIM6/NTAB) family NADH-FMN oxidoreductase RutF
MNSVAPPELAESFREAMSRVCTPVSIVTTIVGDRPHGTTVSAFASLSMSPPMIMVSLAKTSDLLGFIKTSQRFGVNVLGDQHGADALTFARKGESKFRSVEWVPDDGLPRLPMALGWLSCDVADMFEAGDHVILSGVVRVADNLDGQPLTYYLREFGTHHASRHHDA